MSDWIIFNMGIIAILVFVGIIGTMIVWKRIKERKYEEPDYQAFFSIGIIWLPVGVVFMSAINLGLGVAFMAMGVAYMAIGLVNRDKWKKNGVWK